MISKESGEGIDGAEAHEEFTYEDVCSVMHEVVPLLDPEAIIEAYQAAEQKCHDKGIPFQSIGEPPRIGRQDWYRSIRRTDLMRILEVTIGFMALSRGGHDVLFATCYKSHL